MTTKAHHHARIHAHTNGHAHDGTEEIAALKDEITSLRDNVKEGVQTISENGVRVAKSAGTAARATLGQLAQSGGKRVMAATDSARNAIAQRPLTSVSIAAAAGALCAGAYLMLRRRD